MQSLSLHRFALVLAVSTLFLVVAGGMVVSMEAGLSVPDWPLSYGKVMPPMEGGVFYEHGHRMVASTVGFLTIILAVWLQVKDRRSWLKKLGWAALGAVILQGVLGGLTVLFLLPKPVSISHACLAQLFFSTTVAIALFTSPAWQAAQGTVSDTGSPSLRTLAWVTPLAVLGQIALGAAFRHKALGIIPHLAGSLAVSGLLIYFAMVLLALEQQIPLLRRAAMVIIWITISQMVLGIAAYLTRLTFTGVQPAAVMVGFTVAHVATGALTLAAALSAAILTLRFAQIEQRAEAPHAARA
jgi:cytochrome c oxidase assembly protein subunit 15